MMRLILAVVALLAGLAGVGYLAQSQEPVYGVYSGIALVYEGYYYLIEGTAQRTLVNATILNGKFILLGGYLINGTHVEPRHMISTYVNNDVIVVTGSIQVVSGEAKTVGNYTVVTGNPARVFVINGYVYHP